MNNMDECKKRASEKDLESGKRIKAERLAAGFRSQSAFAIAMGYSPDSRQTIGGWEKGESPPNLTDLKRMCELFNCELGYLLCEYDCKTRTETDVQIATGLSENAINALVEYKEKSDAGEVAFSVILQLLSAFIESKDSLIEVARTLVEYENIKTDLDRMEAVSKDVLLVSGKDAKKFLIYNLQQAILEILVETVGDGSNGT